jgi:hypothetical protein
MAVDAPHISRGQAAAKLAQNSLCGLVYAICSANSWNSTYDRCMLRYSVVRKFGKLVWRSCGSAT